MNLVACDEPLYRDQLARFFRGLGKDR
jgi:hypothetical protein